MKISHFYECLALVLSFLHTLGCGYCSFSGAIEVESIVPGAVVVKLARLNYSSISCRFLNDSLGIISS